jgi:hypothetical protein
MKKLATLAVATFIVAAAATQANENPIIDSVENAKDFAVNNKVSQYVINEYNSTVEFQKDSWQQGKDQLGRNKEQIVGVFENIKGAFKFYFGENND